MEIFRYIFFFSVFFIVSCKAQKDPLSKTINYWSTERDKFSIEDGKWTAFLDTLCTNINFSKEKEFKLWDRTYQPNDFLRIEYKNFIVEGKMTTGVPNQQWLYFNKNNCAGLVETFMCGLSTERYSLNVGTTLKDAQYSCEGEEVKNFKKEVLKLVKFRNKLHKKIYDAQRK